MLYINGTGNLSNIETASLSKSGQLFMGPTSAGTIRLLSLKGIQTKKRNPYVHRLIFHWLHIHVLQVCLLKCRSSLQTDILHAYCAV